MKLAVRILANAALWTLWVACLPFALILAISIPGNPGFWDFLAYIGTLTAVTHYPVLLPVFVTGERMARKDGNERRARIFRLATWVISAIAGAVVMTIGTLLYSSF